MYYRTYTLVSHSLQVIQSSCCNLTFQEFFATLLLTVTKSTRLTQTVALTYLGRTLTCLRAAGLYLCLEVYYHYSRAQRLTWLHHRVWTVLLDLPPWTLSSLGLISRRPIDWPRWLAPHVQLSLFITGGDYGRSVPQETRLLLLLFVFLLLSRPRRDSLELRALIPLWMLCVCGHEVERRPFVFVIT